MRHGQVHVTLLEEISAVLEKAINSQQILDKFSPLTQSMHVQP